MRTTSPFFRNFGGLKPMPTPAGVPVAMTSPGSSVMASLIASIRVGMSTVSYTHLTLPTICSV